jgi:hypothetical protein
MKLPRGHRANLDLKLEEYSLNPSHRLGKHKAHVFESLLGITLANKETLAKALLEAATRSENVIAKGDNGIGETFVIRFKMETEKGVAIVLSAWIIRHGEDFPRLTTCYIV